jgi:hypothetical protein
MDANGQSEPRLCKNNDKTPNGAKWVICPEALHREVYLCTNTTTQKHSMCQRPASQLAAMRRGEPVVVKVDSCKAAAGGNSTAHQLLPIQGLQLELHVNLSLCAGEASPQQGTAARGSVGVGVLESADGTERTTIGYDVTSRTLFVERGRSSRLPAANPGGGVEPIFCGALCHEKLWLIKTGSGQPKLDKACCRRGAGIGAAGVRRPVA